MNIQRVVAVCSIFVKKRENKKPDFGLCDDHRVASRQFLANKKK
jgi:hypothetical protein